MPSLMLGRIDNKSKYVALSGIGARKAAVQRLIMDTDTQHRPVAFPADPQGEDLSASAYHNPDMAPVPAAQRTWGLKDMAALWVSLAACIPTYMLASSLIDGGMNWSQAILTIVLGNTIVLVPLVLNAHAGTRYGIPFPVYCRAAFGIRGANVPALLRALVACPLIPLESREATRVGPTSPSPSQ